MDVVERLKEDVREGRISVDGLIAVIATLQRQLDAALQRNAELEKDRPGQTPPTTPKVDEPFSMRAEEKRQQDRQQQKKKKAKRPGRRGRLSSADKLKLAERTEKIFPDGVPEQECHLSHTRPVWRLENGRAVLIAYEIYRGPRNRYGKIPGVLGRSEFGLEIVVQIAYLVYVIGLSFDKVCLTARFLQNLPLGKTQADQLLRQLSRHWQHEFDVLCTLLANSLVVHSDETSWSIHSVWAFLSEKARLLFFGVHKVAVNSVRTASRPGGVIPGGSVREFQLRGTTNGRIDKFSPRVRRPVACVARRGGSEHRQPSGTGRSWSSTD